MYFIANQCIKDRTANGGLKSLLALIKINGSALEVMLEGVVV